MYYFYILHNPEIDKFYIGSSSNLAKRISEHNKHSHKTKFTRKNSGNWYLVLSEQYRDKSEALKREIKVKSWKSKIMIRKLIEQSRR